MAVNERQRQKQLQDKKKKRKLVAKGTATSLAAGRKALQYSKFAMFECLVPEQLFETGLGTIIWVRRMPDGMMAITAFVVDVFCLGVKDALFNVANERTYENMIRPGLTEVPDGQSFRTVEPACARKLIQGAVAYAEGLGFAPHRDYENAKGIFGAVDSLACTEEFTYGRAGRPCYMRGPNESDSRVRQILAQLQTKCGEGGFDYLVGPADGTLE
ncbi:hypothetical protein [Candidatus Thiodictyon syntrophicum]|jgi:hypothetical protein|uniref:Uncharacterized protein n=1 Tax=Candidatus Thiodictyon syntrophicum TaxID=1166950 RepID=A0A2K8UFW4_9GAMM|nr:hypothetical protein [Candidatus Thiodictyon syntrophicum]AUB84440.1 hypothetical protein THSYN_28205 [Candidatus Thiodictyon syntrophicum]